MEIDAEEVIAERLDSEIEETKNDKLLEGEAVVADMPLVDLASDGSEDEFKALEINDNTEGAEEDAEITELREV